MLRAPIQAKAIVIDTMCLSGLDLFLDFVQLVQLVESMLGPMTNAQYIIIKSKVLRNCSRRYFGATALCQKDASPSLLARFREELRLASQAKVTGWKDPGPLVLGTKRVHEYRQAAVLCVQPGDDVLEIGCHCGKTTALLMESQVGARIAVGIDIGPKIVKEARKRYPNVPFRCADGFDTRTLLELANEFAKPRRGGDMGVEGVPVEDRQNDNGSNVYRASFDVILIDVGGLSSDSGLMESLALIRQLSHAFRPRLRAIIIKSACVRMFCGELTPAAAYIEDIELRRRARCEEDKSPSTEKKDVSE